MTSTFDQLELLPPLLRAVRDRGYDKPTPIQVQAIPHVLAGRDVLGCAQTGTGKTAAFALPILQRLWGRPRGQGTRRPILALVLCPTRELATQINESFATYGKHSGLTAGVIFGGVGYPKQREMLTRGVDIVVATPGRLLDLIREKTARFDSLEVLVLDEADRMLDMGFLPDVKRVLAVLPKKRQTLCFSATMPPEIQRLVATILHQPAQVSVAPVASTAEKVEQSVFFTDKNHKPDVLVALLRDPSVERALVFTRTKRGADRVAKRLTHDGIRAEAIHGNKSQNARERALAGFKTGRGKVLVATDIAARGIDVTGITHVINYELPNEPETYVHRIGRTARAAASGIAWALCSGEEREYLRDIERLIRQKIPVADVPSGNGRVVHSTQTEPRRQPAETGTRSRTAPAAHARAQDEAPERRHAAPSHRPAAARHAADTRAPADRHERPARQAAAERAHAPTRHDEPARPRTAERAAPAPQPVSFERRPAAGADHTGSRGPRLSPGTSRSRAPLPGERTAAARHARAPRASDRHTEPDRAAPARAHRAEAARGHRPEPARERPGAPSSARPPHAPTSRPLDFTHAGRNERGGTPRPSTARPDPRHELDHRTARPAASHGHDRQPTRPASPRSPAPRSTTARPTAPRADHGPRRDAGRDRRG